MLGEDIMLNVDIGLLAQVYANFFSNAVKYTEEGWIKVSAELVGEDVVVAVRDTGPGVKSDDMSSLFEEFRQLEDDNARKPGSTGLGLAICKKILEQHRGRIWVESTPGRGSTFFFTVPLNGEPHSKLSNVVQEDTHEEPVSELPTERPIEGLGH